MKDTGLATQKAIPVFSLTLMKKHPGMTRVVIDKKKYVILSEKEYQALQKKAALKSQPEKTLSIASARTRSKKLINKWASEK